METIPTRRWTEGSQGKDAKISEKCLKIPPIISRNGVFRDYFFYNVNNSLNYNK